MRAARKRIETFGGFVVSGFILRLSGFSVERFHLKILYEALWCEALCSTKV